MNSSTLKAIQQKIFLSSKMRMKEFEGTLGEEMKLYRSRQESFAHKQFTLSNSQELLKKIQNSQLIYLGDFHTFDQSTKNLIRILKTMRGKDNRFTIGLELVQSEDQIYLESYMGGFITEKEFLESVDYSESWRFPWTHYREVFQFAKEFNIPIVGLNSKGTLPERDHHAAEIISSEIGNNPDHKFLVLFGELHILPQHLPRLVEEKLRAIPIILDDLIIHQNLDAIHFKIDEAFDGETIVKFSSREYSLQTSPPWMKYQSALEWYENLMDDPDFDFHQYLLGREYHFDQFEPDDIISLATSILEAINSHSQVISHDKIDLEEMTIYSAKNLEYIFDKIEGLKSKKWSKIFKFYLEENEMGALPFSGSYYCSQLSLAKTGTLAGLHVYHSYLRGQNICFKQLVDSADTLQLFLISFKQLLMGSLGAKVLNPYRKCDMYLDLKEENINTVVKALLAENFTVEMLRRKRFPFIYGVAKKITPILSEYIFRQVASKQVPSLHSSLTWVLSPDYSLEGLMEYIVDLVPKDYQQHRKRFF